MRYTTWKLWPEKVKKVRYRQLTGKPYDQTKDDLCWRYFQEALMQKIDASKSRITEYDCFGILWKKGNFSCKKCRDNLICHELSSGAHN